LHATTEQQILQLENEPWNCFDTGFFVT
jgi:hypothetical protein